MAAAAPTSAAAAAPAVAAPSAAVDAKAAAGPKKKLKVAVGSGNAAKVNAVKSAVGKLFPEHELEVVPSAVASGVSAQPMSAAETMKGAKARAHEALKVTPGADYGIGLEGGLEKVGDTWFECGWIVVVRAADGQTGVGTSARYVVSPSIVAELQKGKELAEVIDALTGQSDVRSRMGMMGVITNGHLPRADCYAHGIIFAFAPFLSDAKFWA